jgi:hypothetical protein
MVFKSFLRKGDKMKFLKIAALQAALLSIGGVYADKVDNRKTGVSNCGEKAVDCSVTIHGAGDVLLIDTSKEPVVALNEIDSEKTETVKLPDEIGTQTVYSFTPKTGESAGKLIYIAFNNIKPKVGTRYEGKTLLKVYRHFETDAKLQWTEMGKIVINVPSVKGKDMTTQVVMYPDGTTFWVNDATHEVTPFFPGIVDQKSITKTQIDKAVEEFEAKHPVKG